MSQHLIRFIRIFTYLCFYIWTLGISSSSILFLLFDWWLFWTSFLSLNVVVAYFWTSCWIFKNMCVYTLLLGVFVSVMRFDCINKIKWQPSIYLCVYFVLWNGNIMNVNKTANVIYTKINRLYDGCIRVS